MEAYTYLAQAYDELMADVDYAQWVAYLDALLRQGKAEKLFEAACGTGSLSCRLCALGYDVVASDLSPQMLEIASAKARKSGCGIVFVQQDMRDIKTGGPVDAVVCACDGPNYIDMQGIGQFAAASYRALGEGGRLLFDISTRHKLADVMDGEVFFDDSDDAACIWKNTFDGRALRMDVTLFVRRGALFERFSEQHIQYAHDVAAVKNAVLAAGFARVDAFDWLTDRPPGNCSQRVQFVCVKESI